MTSKELALLFKALSDETRVAVIRLLSKEKRCACQFIKDFNITQPTLSHHMKILCDSGLVNAEKDSKWVYYTINEPTFNQLKDFISSIGVSSTDCVTCK